MLPVLRMGAVVASVLLLAWPDGANAQAEPFVTQADGRQAASSPRLLKRKVAVGRFSNATRYGKALLIDGERDPLAAQAADMLTARLADSGKFMLFERSDLDAVGREQAFAGGEAARLVGVDTLVIGSVTEFGRKVEGKSGFLNSQTRQIATATVEIRLVDVQTGRVFFSAVGKGSASVETKEVAGFGSRAGYDSTLNDKAISAAVSDLMTNLIQRLSERRWFTDVLKVQGDQLFVSGGPSQGLKIGDRFRVERRGELVTSGQSGLPIRLPGRPVATIEVIRFFGDDPATEGAITRLVDGTLGGETSADLVVVEQNP